MNFLSDEDYRLLGCHTVQCGRYLTEFQRKMEAMCFSETSATVYYIMWHHITEDSNIV